MRARKLKARTELIRVGLWMSLALACAPLIRAEQAYVVVVPVADMYSKADENSDVVSQTILGSNVKSVETAQGWLKIQTDDAYTGWVTQDEIRPLLSDNGYAVAGNRVQVSSLQANLYRETNVTAHRPVLAVPFETRLELIAEGKGEDEGWFQVRLPDERTAWIQSGDVVIDAPRLTIPESIALGRRFIGVTYTWGGRSSFGFDCSGFTQMLMRHRGIIMPRDADLQAAWSGVLAVERKHLRAGDLLFFGSSPQHITHTGMFIGHGKFIHDTTNGHPGVQISRLKDQPWTKLLVACRRAK